MTSYADDCWSALIEGLSSIGKVRGREPYGLVVTLPRPDGSVSTVEIVMTREDWLDVATVIHGDVRYAIEYARDVVQAEAGSPYLVYDTYELVPSDTTILPPDPDLAAFQELGSRYPNGVVPGGYWAPSPGGGRLVETLAAYRTSEEISENAAMTLAKEELAAARAEDASP